jgi:hypothetical protein
MPMTFENAGKALKAGRRISHPDLKALYYFMSEGDLKACDKKTGNIRTVTARNHIFNDTPMNNIATSNSGYKICREG